MTLSTPLQAGVAFAGAAIDDHFAVRGSGSIPPGHVLESLDLARHNSIARATQERVRQLLSYSDGHLPDRCHRGCTAQPATFRLDSISATGFQTVC